VVAAAVLVTVAAGCARTSPPPHLVLIVLDTLRADRLGTYGNTRGLTPFLDQLAARGTRFANAYAPSSWTCPSIASLFTSRYPSQHGVTNFEAALNESEVMLAQRLSERGYDSAGFTANFRVTQAFGYTRGFAYWEDYFGDEKTTPKQRGSRLRADSLRWIEARPAPDEPLFLYLQYMEPHMPYTPPEPFLSRFATPASEAVRAAANDKLVNMRVRELSDDEVALLASLYDAETASLDEELRLLFAELERLGVLTNAVVIIAADHGEEFREHGFMSHGMTLFEPGIRIPFLLLAPGYEGGRVIDESVSLLDVAPTVLDLIGAPAEPHFVGRSLVPLLTPGNPLLRARALVASWLTSPPPPDLLTELHPTLGLTDLRVHRAAYLRLPGKLIVPSVGEPEFYDLATDPDERRPKTIRQGEPAAELYTALQEVRAGMSTQPGGIAPAAPPVALDDAAREKLRALGYHP
jgi:arylsulfatase A-like enzyme